MLTSIKLLALCALFIIDNADSYQLPRTKSTVCHHWYRDQLTPNNQRAQLCPWEISKLNNTIYLLYDINPPEGFNLRRDVYIRLAVFVRQLQRLPAFSNVRLVLPPWNRLYHWKSLHLPRSNLPWSSFFDVESLRRYAPVLDFPEFLEEIGKFRLHESPLVPVHKTFQLMPFKEMFDNGVFHDKYDFESNCRKSDHLRGYLLQHSSLLDNDFVCVRYQGSVNLLKRLLLHVLQEFGADEPKVFAILNAEIVLHDHWGDREFWRARRSMRFASALVGFADEYRRRVFNSTNALDGVQRPPMWEYETSHRTAIGGGYLGVHLRRGDFVHGREKTTPTLKSVAMQIKNKLDEYNLTSVYIATDATVFEWKNLKAYLPRVNVMRFAAESLQQKAVIKDGGLAIIDQLICSHSHYFIGTYESTFTYRIYEEREILGFPKSKTFNTFCKDMTAKDCPKNSKWPIVF